MQMPMLADAVRTGAQPATLLNSDNGAGSHGGSELPRRRATGHRAGDVAVALALLALTGPLLLLTALAIRLDSPGPVLVGLPHFGEGGQLFHLLAFRSTKGGVPGLSAPSRIGLLIQPPRIDQLPILFNLLRGDMALSGPPPVPSGSGFSAPAALSLQKPGLYGWLNSA